MSTQPGPRGGFHTPLQQLLLLEERVRQAGVRLPDADMEHAFHGIKCVINGRDCVVNLREVAEVIDKRSVTPIPGTAAWIEGVINYRGLLVPVFRPQDFLVRNPGADQALVRANGPLIVVRKDHKGNEFAAIRVNRMDGMQKFKEAELQPAAADANAADTLEHYVEHRISFEGKSWYRLSSTRLIDKMCGTNPRQA